MPLQRDCASEESRLSSVSGECYYPAQLQYYCCSTFEDKRNNKNIIVEVSSREQFQWWLQNRRSCVFVLYFSFQGRVSNGQCVLSPY